MKKALLLFLAVVSFSALAEVPTGTILAFYGGDQQLPEGYFFCNGDTISKVSDPSLYTHLVLANPKLRVDNERVKLPDLRGEFIRGWDNDRNIDKERKLGSHQSESMKKHTHSLNSTAKNSGVADGSNRNYLNKTASTTTSAVGGNETRPRNIAVNFVIKR